MQELICVHSHTWPVDRPHGEHKGLLPAGPEVPGHGRGRQNPQHGLWDRGGLWLFILAYIWVHFVCFVCHMKKNKNILILSLTRWIKSWRWFPERDAPSCSRPPWPRRWDDIPVLFRVCWPLGLRVCEERSLSNSRCFLRFTGPETSEGSSERSCQVCSIHKILYSRQTAAILHLHTIKVQGSGHRDVFNFIFPSIIIQYVTYIECLTLFVRILWQDCYLVSILNELAGNSFIIFCSTCNNAQRVALLLRNLGITAIPLHGQMSQVELEKETTRTPFAPLRPSVTHALDASLASWGTPPENYTTQKAPFFFFVLALPGGASGTKKWCKPVNG